MDKRTLLKKNIGFGLAVLFLWATVHFLYVSLGGKAGGFVGFDVLFVFLPPIAAFFMNWRWLRQEHTDRLLKWAVYTAAIDLTAFLVLVFFAAAPLHRLLARL